MKKDIEIEYTRYCSYLNNYFPETSINDSHMNQEMSALFEATMSLSKVAYHLSENLQILYASRLIEYNLNNLLYFLPLNEPVSLSMCLRNTVEATIKLIFTLENPEIDYKYTGFRTFNDKKNELNFYKSNIPNKNKVDNIFSIYGKRSNLLHLKKIEETNLMTVLESKLKRDVDVKFLRELTTDINNCKLTLLEIIVFYKIELTTGQKINLNRYVSSNWAQKIYAI